MDNVSSGVPDVFKNVKYIPFYTPCEVSCVIKSGMIKEYCGNHRIMLEDLTGVFGNDMVSSAWLYCTPEESELISQKCYDDVECVISMRVGYDGYMLKGPEGKTAAIRQWFSIKFDDGDEIKCSRKSTPVICPDDYDFVTVID